MATEQDGKSERSTSRIGQGVWRLWLVALTICAVSEAPMRTP